MPHLNDISDRVWFALHCLPRDASGAPPSYKSLEEKYGLPDAFFSKLVRGSRKQGYGTTFSQLAKALKVSQTWLDQGGDDGTPTPTGVVPPRPDKKWIRYGDLPTWGEAVAEALRDPEGTVPPAAFLAGADMPEFRAVDRVTPATAIAIALYAWETCTEEEQFRYEELARSMSPSERTARPRAEERRAKK